MVNDRDVRPDQLAYFLDMVNVNLLLGLTALTLIIKVNERLILTWR